MIFDSIPTMSIIDGLILGILLFGFGYAVYRRREIHFGNAKFGSFLIGLGLFILGGFYTHDLTLMHVFPRFMPRNEAMDLMRDLHLNQSWIVKLFATGFIVWGFISLVSRLAFINLKLEMLVQERTSDLAESELRHKKAQSMVHLGSWAWNIKTGEENWSIEQYKIFGLDPDGSAASYDDFLNAVHPDDRQSVLTAIDDSIKGVRAYNIEFRIIRPDDEIRFIHAQGDISRDDNGEPENMLGTVLDITDRKQAEKKLRLLEYEIENAEEGIFTLDVNGRILGVNGIACRRLGYSRDELLNMNVSDINPAVSETELRRKNLTKVILKWQGWMPKPQIDPNPNFSPI